MIEQDVDQLFRDNASDAPYVKYEDGAFVVSMIEELFPFCGSRINWSQMRNVCSRVARDEFYAEDCSRFFRDVIKENALVGEVLYINDSAFDCAYQTDISIFSVIIEGLVVLPQHHYFTCINAEWCMVFSMTRDCDFGWASRE